jgi:glycosyltransferase involved in cell wall biosynthesis
MKVLLYDDTPACLCHGGKQVHAAQLATALTHRGVDVEYLRWWDPAQRCDVLHMLGCQSALVRMAHEAGASVVLTHVTDHMTNAPELTRLVHRARNLVLRRGFPPIARLFPWHVLPSIDGLVYLHTADAETAIDLYGVPRERTHVIPHACTADLLRSFDGPPNNCGSYLVSVGSIVPRKNAVALARAARRAKVSVVFVGKPFSESDPYFAQFARLVDGRYVVYRGYVTEAEKTKLLSEASGFVLLSRAESGCIAIYEAAAAHLPMLLSDLPWAHAYGSHVHVQHVSIEDEAAIASHMASFFAAARRLDHVTFPVQTWEQVADAYRAVYETVARSSRKP